jgi:hypothetical protein
MHSNLAQNWVLRLQNLPHCFSHTQGINTQPLPLVACCECFITALQGHVVVSGADGVPHSKEVSPGYSCLYIPIIPPDTPIIPLYRYLITDMGAG